MFAEGSDRTWADGFKQSQAFDAREFQVGLEWKGNTLRVTHKQQNIFYL